MTARNWDRLRSQVLDGDNKACFIERETILRKSRAETLALPDRLRYLFEFERLLAEVSTPIDPADIVLGRVVEGRWPEDAGEFSRIPDGLGSEGHMVFDYPALLEKGLRGMCEETRAAAEADPSFNKCFFAESAERACAAVVAYAHRYAAAARHAAETEADPVVKAWRLRAAAALERVPESGATDFFGAVQSVALIHLILSAYVGARDFAFGRLDQVLLPYYRRDLAAGTLTREEAREVLAGLFFITNLLAGTAAHDFAPKPIPCNSSKQYLTVGGLSETGANEYNEVSALIVEAAELVRLPQPTLNFRLSASLPDAAWSLAARAVASLDAQSNFFNDDVICASLKRHGIPEKIAYDCAFTGCNRLDLPGHLPNIMRRIDHFDDTVARFRKVLLAHPEAQSVTELRGYFRADTVRMAEEYGDAAGCIFSDAPIFRFESLGFPACRRKASDIYNGAVDEFRWQHHMFLGIATIADGLAAIRKFVFEEKRLTPAEFNALLESNFAGREAFRQEILSQTPHFGNDDDAADDLAVAVANDLIDAVEEAGARMGYLEMCSFYSLSLNVYFGHDIGATPDGRPAGAPVSENQSPSYGMDRDGPTALLKSVAKLPLGRCVSGGLNLKLACCPDEKTAADLLRTYFGMGGLHLGFTLVDRRTLEAARLRPEEYRTLCVRLYGFSEFFNALSPEFQDQVIERTEY